MLFSLENVCNVSNKVPKWGNFWPFLICCRRIIIKVYLRTDYRSHTAQSFFKAISWQRFKAFLSKFLSNLRDQLWHERAVFFLSRLFLIVWNPYLLVNLITDHQAVMPLFLEGDLYERIDCDHKVKKFYTFLAVTRKALLWWL